MLLVTIKLTYRRINRVEYQNRFSYAISTIVRFIVDLNLTLQ